MRPWRPLRNQTPSIKLTECKATHRRTIWTKTHPSLWTPILISLRPRSRFIRSSHDLHHPHTQEESHNTAPAEHHSTCNMTSKHDFIFKFCSSCLDLTVRILSARVLLLASKTKHSNLMLTSSQHSKDFLESLDPGPMKQVLLPSSRREALVLQSVPASLCQLCDSAS